MPQKITFLSSQFKRYFSSSTVVSSVTTRIPLQNLPWAQLCLLYLFYEDRLLGVEMSVRTLAELSLRFGLHSNTISTYLNELELWGYLQSISCGQNGKKRWITFEAFEYLDNLPRNQNKPIPYIDPSKTVKTKNKIIINNNISDEEEENTQELDPYERLERFLNSKEVSKEEQNAIKESIVSSRIGPGRTQKLISRVIAAWKKKPVLHHLAYFKACVRTEIKQIFLLFDLFRNIPLPVNMYAI